MIWYFISFLLGLILGVGLMTLSVIASQKEEEDDRHYRREGAKESNSGAEEEVGKEARPD